MNTLTQTSLARVPLNTLTTALTLPTPSLTEYSVMLKPIVTPEKVINMLVAKTSTKDSNSTIYVYPYSVAYYHHL